MRLAILSSPDCRVISGAWVNGADPKALPILLADRAANGEGFPEERIVRLPRRFSHMHKHDVARYLGRGAW